MPECTREDDRQALPYRLKGTVKVQNAPIGVVIILDQLQWDDLSLREETLEEAYGVLICTCGAIAVEVGRQVASQEYPTVSKQCHIATLHGDVIGCYHYLIRIYLRPDRIVRLHLLLSVSNDIGADKRTSNNKPHIPGKDLLHTPMSTGAQDSHALPLHQ